MIIATIAHQHFVLKNLEDAEALLKILSDATPADTEYLNHSRIYFAQSGCEVSITINSGELKTKEEIAALKAADY